VTPTRAISRNYLHASDLWTRWAEIFPFSAALFCSGIVFKFLELRETGYVHASFSFSYLHLFGGEVWDCVIIFPAILLLAGFLFPAQWRKWAYFVLLEAVLFDGFVQWATFRELGEFPGRDLIADFFSTLKVNPGFLAPTNLLDRKEQAMLVVTICAGMVASALSWWMARRLPSPGKLLARWWIPGLACLVLVCLVLVAGWLPVGARGSNYARAGVLERTVFAWKSSESNLRLNDSSYQVANPLVLFQRLSLPMGTQPARAGNYTPSISKQSAPPNVIFIVLETAGWSDYPFSGPDCRMPHVNALLPHSLYAHRHYSTSIESLRANFSIYTSLYDLLGREPQQYFARHLVNDPAVHMDALPRILADHGYVTRYYFPSLLWPKNFEKDSLRLYGFQVVRMGRDIPVPRDAAQELEQWNRLTLNSSPAEKMSQESTMYEMAEHDVVELHAQKKPFFFALAGSIGHAPFIDIRSAADIARDPNPSRKNLVGNIAAFQDQLIGSLVDKLQQLGLLENTILMITGDHGPRTRRDDPNLDLTFANDENFHVPLLIRDPAVFSKTVEIDQITSHLDITPTILQLLGLQDSRYQKEGMSMFDPNLKNRIVFYLGQQLRGFDADSYHGLYLMHSVESEKTFVNTSFRFSAQNEVDVNRSTDDVKRLFAALQQLQTAQEAWIAYLRHPEVSEPRSSQ
jgi:arylsulfatase A-like enzyme